MAEALGGTFLTFTLVGMLIVSAIMVYFAYLGEINENHTPPALRADTQEEGTSK